MTPGDGEGDRDRLIEELGIAVATGRPFGPNESNEEKLELPAEVLVELLRGQHEGVAGPGRVWIRGAKITGSLALEGHRLDLRIYFEHCEFDGQVNILQADLFEIGFTDCELKAGLQADQINVRWNLLLDRSTLVGGVSLMEAKIGGQLSMSDAHLERKESVGGWALRADGMEATGGVIADRVEATGEVRMFGVKIGDQLSLKGASLTGVVNESGATWALAADRIEVAEGLVCDELQASGEVRLLGAKIGGQLSLIDAVLVEAPSSERALGLMGATLDELILGFARVDGAVDLQQAEVRSLWDTRDGSFRGQRPSRLRLDGFVYRSLREPLDADRRLEWIESSQEEHYYPGVYSQLAEAFRKIGQVGDARKVAIEGERRARKELPTWSPRGAWQDLLFVTIGYGYRNWLAAIWLSGFLLVGMLLFCLEADSFDPTQSMPPDFNAVLYAIDVTIPVLDVGQQSAWTPTGCMTWVSLILTVVGYALATAVIAAAAGLLNRDQR